MVCLDRDRGAISCCSGGARLRAWPRAPGQGIGGGEDRGAVRGAPCSPLRGICDCRGPRDAVGTRPCCWSRCRLWVLVPPSPEPGTGVREQPAQGWGPRNKLPVPHVLDWACKELKKNIYMCGFFGQGSESTCFPPPPLPRNYPTYSERQHLCRTVCVCLVQVESCPYKLCSVDFCFQCVSGVFFLSSCKHGRLWCWGVA